MPDPTSPTRRPPRLAATAGRLPDGHREAYAWRFCDQEGFSLATRLAEFRITRTTEEGLAARRGPDRAVRDRCGVYHLMDGRRSYCLGAWTGSDWCASQCAGSTEYTLDVTKVPLAERCERAAGRWPP